MNRDKQIEEMIDVIELMPWKMTHDRVGCRITNSRELAAYFYHEGYRKASEVAEDIIRMLRAAGISEWRYPIVADIKKKYMEG